MSSLARRAAAAHLRRHADRTDGGPRTEYLAFLLSGEVYGVPVALVREILRPPPLTRVPRAAHAVMGIVSVRGKLVTVLDLRRRLRLAEPPHTSKARILLVGGPAGETLGLYVDEVLQVLRLAEPEVELAAAAIGGDFASHIAGIARPAAAAGLGVSSAVVVLLDLRALLAS